jgi:hypothetical protein
MPAGTFLDANYRVVLRRASYVRSDPADAACPLELAGRIFVL